ncbi:MAG TPA: corrinoid protein [Anaerolineae bacterium]|nr:corrinoid protein [Anaerolineae bacterium]
MDLKTLYDAVVNGEKEAVEEGVRAALAAGISASHILNQALVPAMAEVGRLFEAQEYYVPEMLVSAKAMQAGVNILKPHLTETDARPAGIVVFGTVKGDLHDIGKNLVIMMLEGAGFQVTDLGVDVHPDRFVQAARDGAQLIGMSAMLTTTMPNMQVTIDALRAACVRDRVKVMVGGAPLTQAYAEQIGADGYSADASSAARKARELLA